MKTTPACSHLSYPPARTFVMSSWFITFNYTSSLVVSDLHLHLLDVEVGPVQHSIDVFNIRHVRVGLACEAPYTTNCKSSWTGFDI